MASGPEVCGHPQELNEDLTNNAGSITALPEDTAETIYSSFTGYYLHTNHITDFHNFASSLLLL